MKEHFNFDKLIKEDVNYELARPNETRFLNAIEAHYIETDFEDLFRGLLEFLPDDKIADFVKYYYGKNIDDAMFDSNEYFDEDEEFENEIDKLDDIAPED